MLVTAAVTVLLGAALHCGGKVEVESLPDCPTDGTCTSACKATVAVPAMCGESSSLQACDCVSGQLQCPVFRGGPPTDCVVDDCMGNVDQGASCSTKGARCTARVQTRCYGNGLDRMCTCNGATFACDPPPPDCEPPPMPVCPDPDSIRSGALCGGGGGGGQYCARAPQLDCNGTYVKSECICPQGPNARWQCDEIGCAQDAGSPK
jgi:hypothetical protein